MVNKQSISFMGKLVLFLSVLFNELSFQIVSSLFFILGILYLDYLFVPKLWLGLNELFILFYFLLLQNATNRFFSNKKVFAKTCLGCFLAFGASTAGIKKYVFCFPKKFCQKKIMCYYDLSKVMFPLGGLFKMFCCIVFFVLFFFGIHNSRFTVFTFLIGFFSEVFSHILFFIYYKYCHVWKDISLQKRNLNIFNSHYEII